MNQPCPRCGRPNPGIQTFCSACGAQLKSTSTNNGTWKLIIGTFVIIAGLSWAGFMLSSSKPEQSNAPHQQSLFNANANAVPLATASESTRPTSASSKPAESKSPVTIPPPAPRAPDIDSDDMSDDDSQSADSSDDSDTYINSDGEEVPRPRRSDTVPDGATARCRDGSYSFSRHHQGTCSHHGGVAEWLD